MSTDDQSGGNNVANSQEKFHFSKIRDIRIELKNYSFFHSPSEMDMEDRRFIGRKEIKNKLRTFLENNEARSGAYLITGYRGMGKSSVIAKVLSEMQSLDLKLPNLGRFLRIFLPLIPILFFEEDRFPFYFSTLPLLFLFFGMAYFIKFDPNSPNIRVSEQKVGPGYSMIYLAGLLFVFGTLLFLLEPEVLKDTFGNLNFTKRSQNYSLGQKYISAILISGFFVFVAYSAFSLRWDESSGKKLTRAKFISRQANKFFDLFYIRRNISSNHRFRNLVQDVVIFLIVYITIEIFVSMNHWHDFYHKVILFVSVLSVLGLGIVFRSQWFFFQKKVIRLIRDFSQKRDNTSSKKANASTEKQLANHSIWSILLVLMSFPVSFFMIFVMNEKDLITGEYGGSATFWVLALFPFLIWACLFGGLDLQACKKLDPPQKFKVPAYPIIVLIGSIVCSLFYPEIGLFSELIAIFMFLLGTLIFPKKLSYGAFLLRHILLELRRNVKKKTNFSRLEVIKINLGQDELKDVDVLKGVARGLFNRYSGIQSALGLRILRFFVIFFVVGLLYYHGPFNNVTNDLKKETGYFNLFPTQVGQALDNSKEKFLFDFYCTRITEDTHHGQQTYFLYWALQPENIKKALSRAEQFGTDLLNAPKSMYFEPLVRKYPDFKMEIWREKLVKTFVNSGYSDKFFGVFSLVVAQFRPTSSDFFEIIGPEDSLEFVEINALWEADSNQPLSVPESIDRLAKYTLSKSEKSRKAPEPSYKKNWGTLFFNYMDVLLYNGYKKVRASLFDSQYPIQNTRFTEIFTSDLELKRDYFLIPLRIDYLFFLFVFLTFFFFRFISRYRPFGIYNHVYIRRRLKKLNRRIVSEITREQGEHFAGEAKSGLLSFLLMGKKQRKYPIMSFPEIEGELISILAAINAIPPLLQRPEFVFIFDELDKIEHKRNSSLRAQEDEQLINGESARDFLSHHTSRRRQDAIFNILGSLKHFLNTAKSKFIFIAGREMYDASLADNSARDSFIKSIFHEELYVSSFLSDASDEKLSDVTSMTEQYVCQFLLPNRYHDRSLRAYNSYLQEFIDKTEPNVDEKERTRKRLKVILTLQNFITYLTYRSNGAPKKITRLFEHYVQKVNEREIAYAINADGANQSFIATPLSIGENSESLYLCFSYFDQYVFGMSSFLTLPYLLAVNKYLKDFGDKMLVSTSFLVDHLFKFHKIGFSWRNLELTPEIVDIHKAPELRRVISDILEYLSDTHLQEILSGLHNFRFTHQIRQEIGFLSKISERESAAFNFTLDESLEIKKHYKRRLQELQSKYHPPILSHKNENFVHSIAFIQMILGDLHFIDEEYDDAIIEYMEAIQDLRSIPSETMGIYKFVLLIRNMLKLGLTFEKKKTSDSAFMTYGKISSLIIGVREIDIRELGILETLNEEGNIELIKANQELFNAVREEEFSHNKKRRLAISRRERFPFTKSQLQSEFPNGQFHLQENLIDVLNELEASPGQEDLLLSISLFEGIRLIYQPLLAKLQLIEKNHLGGITHADLMRAQKEFEHIISAIEKQEKHLVKAEYLDKVGDILFYKNGWVIDYAVRKHLDSNYMGRGKELTDGEKSYFKKEAIYCRRRSDICQENVYVLNPSNDPEREKLRNEFKSPCSACSRYMGSVEELYTRHIPGASQTKNIALGLFIFFARDKKEGAYFDNISSNYLNTYLKAMGNALSDVGDTFISCSTKHHKIRIDFLHDLFSFMDDPHAKNAKLLAEKNRLIETGYFNTLSKPEEAICYYYFSSRFSREAGEYKEASFQLRKILPILRKYLEYQGKQSGKFWQNSRRYSENVRKSFEKDIQKVIVKPAIELIHKAFRHTIQLEFKKYERLLKPHREWSDELDTKGSIQDIEKKFLKNNMSISPETREIVLSFLELKRLFVVEQSEGINDLPKDFISPFMVINGKSNRIKELFFKERINHSLFKEAHPNTEKNAERRAEILADSIFCLNEIIKTHKIFGVSFSMHHSSLAEAHEKMAGWLEKRQEAKNICSTQLEGLLNDLLDEVERESLSSTYHQKMANLHYQSAIQTHNEGKAYHQIINEMYYLDDDFNDNYLHFNVALERYSINTGDIPKRLELLKEKENTLESESSDLYDVESYYL